MARKQWIGLVVVVIMLTAAGCYYDKEDLVYPVNGGTSNCDTIGMTFTNHILPIIQAKCNSCHTGAATSGFDFSNYNIAKSKALSGVMLQRLTTSDVLKLMPQGGPKLPDCDIAKFRSWARDGAPQ